MRCVLQQQQQMCNKTIHKLYNSCGHSFGVSKYNMAVMLSGAN